jgi:hypothetical protein
MDKGEASSGLPFALQEPGLMKSIMMRQSCAEEA